MRKTYDEIEVMQAARMQQFHKRHKALELFKASRGAAYDGVMRALHKTNGRDIVSYNAWLEQMFILGETISEPATWRDHIPLMKQAIIPLMKQAVIHMMILWVFIHVGYWLASNT